MHEFSSRHLPIETLVSFVVFPAEMTGTATGFPTCSSRTRKATRLLTIIKLFPDRYSLRARVVRLRCAAKLEKALCGIFKPGDLKAVQ